MRDFLNAILGFIGAASLSDDEFILIQNVASQSYTLETFGALQLILDTRESVTDSHTRLRYFFLARGVSVAETVTAKSQIFLGCSLED